MSGKIRSKTLGVRAEPGEISQYLKVDRSTMRFRKLLLLASLSGCNWQTLAREAIDEMLERELGPRLPPSR